MSWGQPFRLRHMATGMFLGVNSGDPSDFDEEEESGWSLENKSIRRRKPHQLTLINLNKATKDTTAFYFSKANVSV